MENNQGRLKKLVLHKETVRKLTEGDLGKVWGGRPPQEVTDFHISTYCDTAPGSCSKNSAYVTC